MCRPHERMLWFILRGEGVDLLQASPANLVGREEHEDPDSSFVGDRVFRWTTCAPHVQQQRSTGLPKLAIIRLISTCGCRSAVSCFLCERKEHLFTSECVYLEYLKSTLWFIYISKARVSRKGWLAGLGTITAPSSSSLVWLESAWNIWWWVFIWRDTISTLRFASATTV